MRWNDATTTCSGCATVSRGRSAYCVMQLRDAVLARLIAVRHRLGQSTVPLCALVGILISFSLVARAAQPQRLGAAPPPLQSLRGAGGEGIALTPADAVDSLVAARRATVLDTRPVTREREPAASPRCVRADTVASRGDRRLLGRKAGNCHPAFRHAGSPLDSLWPV